jgi:hypothetical protein
MSVMKDEPVFILRKEVDRVKELLTDLYQNGILTTVVAVRNTGKTVFFTTLKDEIERTDPTVLIINHEIKRIDNLESFLRDINMKMQLEITSDVPEGMKELKVSSVQSNLAAGRQISTLVSNIETVLPSNIMPATNKLADEPQLLDQFIRLLEGISDLKKADTVVIMIDNLDNLENTEYKLRFSSLFNDIKDKIPAGVMIIVASDDHMIESNYVISLPPQFKDYEIRDFILKNFPGLDEDIISMIVDKTGGYPAALGWLWRTYNPTEDITRLLNDISKKGVIAQLQDKFLKGFMRELNDKERFVFKICGLIPVVDNRLVSRLAAIDSIEAENILRDFKARDIVTVVIPSAGSELSDLYSMRKPFQIAINSSAFETDLKSKALTYFTDSLLRREYPITLRSIIINIILEIFVDLDKTGNIQRLFDLMSIESENKVVAWSVIISFYFISENEEKVRQLVSTFPHLSNYIKKEKVRNAWQLYVEVINLVLSGNKDEVIERLNRIISLLVDEEDSLVKSELLNISKSMKALYSAENFGDVDSIINAVLEIQPAQAVTMPSRKIQSLSIAWSLGENALGAMNFDMGLRFLVRASELLENLTEEEEAELENSLQNYGHSLDGFVFDLEIELAIALFLRAISATDLDDKERKDLIKLSIEGLEQVKSDPVKGEIYLNATRYLEELEKET